MSETQSLQGQLEWRDLSCILLLAARTEARTSSSVAVFASLLCDMVVMHDRDIENHAFLNIAVGFEHTECLPQSSNSPSLNGFMGFVIPL